MNSLLKKCTKNVKHPRYYGSHLEFEAIAQNAKGCQLGTRQIFYLHIILDQKMQRTNVALSLQALVRFHQTRVGRALHHNIDQIVPCIMCIFI